MIQQSHSWAYYLEKNMVWKDTCTSKFTAAPFTIAKTEKEKNKKRYKWTYLQNRNRLTDLDNELMVTSTEGWRVGGRLGDWDWHVYTDVYKIDD